MNAALWISKSGLTAQDARMNTISNNLANVSTTGFKRDVPVFQDLLYQIDRQPGGQSSQNSQLPSGLQVGTGVKTAATKKQHTEGNIQVTNQSLDVAINGRGFLKVMMPDGSTNYTRDGALSMSSEGQLVTATGLPIEPAINIPPGSQSITIGSDGTVSVVDAATHAQTTIGNIQLADFMNPAGLEAAGNNLFRETMASGAPTEGTPGLNGIGSLIQGSLESSNVNVVEEMVAMIETQRAYEMNSKVISTVDQMLANVSEKL